jgi:hypothetical protein
MLEPDALADMAAAFGVAEDQVRRDHLISHLLFALAQLKLPVVFFGGTTLARTHLTDSGTGARLSEDVDLYSAVRKETAATLDEELPRRLRREFPRLRWEPSTVVCAIRGPGPTGECGRHPGPSSATRQRARSS